MEGPLLNMQPGRPATNNDVPRVVKAPLGQSAAEIVLRLQKAAIRSRVRVEEGFKDFDRHRCGAITNPNPNPNPCISQVRRDHDPAVHHRHAHRLRQGRAHLAG